MTIGGWIREATEKGRERWRQEVYEEGRRQAMEELRRETQARREGYTQGYEDAKAGKPFMLPGRDLEDITAPLA